MSALKRGTPIDSENLANRPTRRCFEKRSITALTGQLLESHNRRAIDPYIVTRACCFLRSVADCGHHVAPERRDIDEEVSLSLVRLCGTHSRRSCM